ncbi:unnamed protein product [Lactuca virosa]|uniref:Uncharacterized protein n=1 Tax=Lactuca virosa TaxID=75947 RepID=A0AAU9PMM6_9ASTR|nr:unnamed protein product [Lactuca virosa]
MIHRLNSSFPSPPLSFLQRQLLWKYPFSPPSFSASASLRTSPVPASLLLSLNINYEMGLLRRSSTAAPEAVVHTTHLTTLTQEKKRGTKELDLMNMTTDQRMQQPPQTAFPASIGGL